MKQHFFRLWTASSGGQWSLKEDKQGELTVAQLTLASSLERVFQHSWGRGKPHRAWQTPWVEDTTENQETRAARMSWAEYCRGERSEIHRGSRAWVLNSEWGNYRSQRKNLQKEAGGTIPGVHTGLRRAPLPTSQSEKILSSREQGREPSEWSDLSSAATWDTDYRLLWTCLRRPKSKPQEDQTDA